MVKTRSYEGDILSWEFIEFEDWREFVEFTGDSEEHAKMLFGFAKKMGKNVAIERIYLKSKNTEGFCNVTALLKQLHDDLQNVLIRKALTGSKLIERCEKCSNYYFSGGEA